MQEGVTLFLAHVSVVFRSVILEHSFQNTLLSTKYSHFCWKKGVGARLSNTCLSNSVPASEEGFRVYSWIQ